MKTLIISHESTKKKRAFLFLQFKEMGFEFFFTDHGWLKSINEIKDYQQYDAVIFFVCFRDLIRKPDFNWNDYKGKKIIYDFDIHMNYSTWAGAKYLGKWNDVIKRNGFDVTVTTGKGVRNSLIWDGINAVWIPKGFDSSRFTNLNQDRNGFCYFGKQYEDRKKMLDFVGNIDILKPSFKDLNYNLNQHYGCIMHNGIEPMEKHFETSGCGCVPITNYIPELKDLGYVDGETMVSYNCFEELVEKLNYYNVNIDELKQIGIASEEFTRNNHSWTHRMKDFKNLINEEVKND